MTVAAASMILVAIVGAVDVVSTAFFRAPLPLSVELSSYFMSLMIFGAMALAQRRQEHVAVDLVVRLLPTGVRRALATLSLALGTAVFVVLTWRSLVLALDSVEMHETAAAAYAFPVWPFKVAVTILLCAATLEFLRQLIWSLAGRDWIPPKMNSEELH